MHKKYLAIIIITLVAFWYWQGRTLLWQRVFGKPSDSIVTDTLFERIEMLPQPFTTTADFANYKVWLNFRASYQAYARVVYVDVYDKGFYFGFKTDQQKLNEAYNAVSPLDLSLFIGQTAADGNWQKIAVSHEYRVLIWQYDYDDNPVVNMSDISNSHIIPANNNIRRAFDTLSSGDIIFIKGYLIDWHDTGEFAEYEYKTALTPGEIADFKIGGKTSGLCRQFYVTQIIADGYSYQ